MLLLYMLQWQYAFISYGISSQAKKWFNTYEPITYNTNLLTSDTKSFMNKLDPNKVFKSKKMLISPNKGPVQPTGGQKGPSGSPSTTKGFLTPGNPAQKKVPSPPHHPHRDDFHAQMLLASDSVCRTIGLCASE